MEAIAAGRVRVGGSPAQAPARLVGVGEPIQVVGEPPRFVSRGGEKLAAALERFALSVHGRRALDAGSSTGGFTDCLLQAGAAHVDAVDVGRGQLAWPLRDDPRVTVREKTNVRTLLPEHLGGAVDVTVADLSFISLITVAPALARCTMADGDLVLLVKPQFEAGRARVGKGGIVRDPDVHRSVLREVRDGLAGAGLFVVDVMPSPLTGADGNVEFFVRCDAHGPALDDDRLDRGRHGVTMTVRAVGLVPHPHREAAAELARYATVRLAGVGIDVRCPGDPAAELDPAGLDVVISLGGDGTMLRAVDLAYEAGVPVLGVNVGQMGYLTEVEPEDFDSALDRLVAGDYEVAERMVLEITVESAGPAEGRWFALNEAVLEKVAHRPTRPAGSRDQRDVLHDLRRRRSDRRHPDRLHRVFVLGARSDRVAPSPVSPPDPGVAAHAVRPFARTRGRGDVAVRRVR